MKRIPGWFVIAEILLAAWFVLAAVSVLVYAPFWLVGGINQRRRRPAEHNMRLWPLIAVLSLIAGVVIIILTRDDLISNGEPDCMVRCFLPGDRDLCSRVCSQRRCLVESTQRRGPQSCTQALFTSLQRYRPASPFCRRTPPSDCRSVDTRCARRLCALSCSRPKLS